LFPTSDDAYKLLLTDCATEINLAQTTWQGQVEADQGKDTVRLYKSAAEACLGRWDEAIATFDMIDKSNPQFGTVGVCALKARSLVYQWLSALIDERKNDPTFSPVFVASSGPEMLCGAATTSTGPAEQTTTTTTSTAPTTTVPPTTTGN
jgi:hypothetical protein